jgi:hypothetical protein
MPAAPEIITNPRPAGHAPDETPSDGLVHIVDLDNAAALAIELQVVPAGQEPSPNPVASVTTTQDKRTRAYDAGTALLQHYRCYVTVTGSTTGTITCASSDESVFTCAIDGDPLIVNLTHIADGTATLSVTNTSGEDTFTAKYRIQFRSTAPSVADNYIGGTAGSARRGIEDYLDILDDPDPPSRWALFSAVNHTSPAYTRKTSISATVDLSGISPWNSTGGEYRGGTAITPRHVVWAAHYDIGTGATMRFVQMDNTVVDRTITAKTQIAGTDIMVGKLSSDLPAGITPVQVLPADWADFFPTGLQGCCAFSTAGGSERFFVKEIATAGGTFSTFQPPGELPFGDPSSLDFLADYDRGVIAGDSGNPVFLLGDDTNLDEIPILISHWFTAAGGPFYPGLRDELEAAITALGAESHTLTDADLQDFTDFS